MNSAFFEYRIAFEGSGAEAVTSPLMEKITTDGVERVKGLIRDGISIEEEVDIARAMVESNGMSVTVVDRQRDDFWTTHFSRHPETRTWLKSGIDATTSPVTVNVDSTMGFSIGDYFHIGTECFRVLGLDGSNMEATRAHRGTLKQAHYTEGGENLTRPQVALEFPFGLQGRRVRVYEYDTSKDDLQGDGRLIWRGVVTSGPELAENGCEWNVLIDSIYRLLAQDVGGDTETPFDLRGFTYGPDAVLLVEVKYIDGSGSVSIAPSFGASGHFETVADLVAEINSNIPPEVATFTDGHAAGSFVALTFEDGGWGISIRTAGTETGTLQIKVFDASLGGWNDLEMGVYTGSSATHIFEFTTPMRAPRGSWGTAPNVIYPAGLVLLNVGDTIVLESDDSSVAYEVIIEDDANRAYTLSGAVPFATSYFTPATVPRFKRYSTYVSRGTLADFRNALVANGPIDANRGAAPFLTDEDLAPWSLAVSQAITAAGSLSQRRYIVAQEQRLDEMLSHECRLIGVYPRLTGDGRIGMKLLEMPTGSTPPEFELNDSNILIDEAPPSWQPNMFGTLNVAKLKTGYNPAEDEHNGPTFDVRDVTSLSIRKRTQQLLIEPVSMDAATFDGNDVVNAFRRVLGIFSRPYAIIDLQAPHALRDVALIGSVCTITSHRLPNITTGRRGIENVKAIVVRRAWNAATGRVDLSLLASATQTLGYAPSAFIVNTFDLGGNSFILALTSLDLEGDDMFPPELKMSDAFPVGTVIQVMEWDSYTQNPQQATVTAVSDFDATVTFESPPTLTGVRYIRYGPANAVTLASQKGWAYMANEDSVIEFASGDESATEFSP